MQAPCKIEQDGAENICQPAHAEGRGSFTLTFARYEQLPKEKEAEVIADAKSMMEEE